MSQTPIQITLWNHRLAQITEEMGAALRRSALSPNIKERRDYSCALCDGEGRLLAQAAHIPVHLGSTATAVQAVLRALPLGPADVAIVNDPYAGGTHLPDITLVAPVYAAPADDSAPVLLGYLAVRAHHADVGGALPGSTPVGLRGEGDHVPSRGDEAAAVGPRYLGFREPPPVGAVVPLTLDDEGLRLPPQLLTDAVRQRLSGCSRGPAERLGDLAAQEAALRQGQRRLQALSAQRGAAAYLASGRALIEHTAAIAAQAVRDLPDGVYAYADSLDDDGAGTQDIGVRLTLQIQGERMILDFTESDDETAGSLNAVRAVTESAVLYALRLLLPEGTPTNHGCLAPLTILTRPGSVLDARPPRAVSAGNTETAQRVVDVVLGALHRALPERIPAASCGSMNNVLLGTADSAYYETLAGGAGASASQDGASAIHTHMTNTRNTPVEALEHAVPVLVRRYAVRAGSGGNGVHPGGDGVVREFELRAPLTVTLVGERRRRPPYGLSGGGNGALGRDTLTRGGETLLLPAKVSFAGQPGDVLTIETPGGGGWKDPRGTYSWLPSHYVPGQAG